MAQMQLNAKAGTQEIVITQVFNGKRELVFRLYTDSNHIPEWWGPRRLTTTVHKMRVKSGGVWRFVQRDAVGSEYAFNGVYHEVSPPERMVYTFEFEGKPGHVLLETLTFQEREGRTILTDQMVFQSVEDRDDMLAAGMESGAAESMERFAELLVKIQKRGPQESNLPVKLARPARRALLQAGYLRLEQLSLLSESHVKQLHGVGPKALDQLRRALAAKGLSFTNTGENPW